jgi:hypothetical protein
VASAQQHIDQRADAGHGSSAVALDAASGKAIAASLYLFLVETAG